MLDGLSVIPNVDECLGAVSVDRRIAEIPSIAPARREFLVVRCRVSVGVMFVFNRCILLTREVRVCKYCYVLISGAGIRRSNCGVPTGVSERTWLQLLRSCALLLVKVS
jgi:hypothetical protein